MYFVLIIVTHYTHYLSSHWKSAHIATIKIYLLADNWIICRLPRGEHDFQQQHTNVLHTILRDTGAVRRAGRKGATKLFKHGRKSPWVPSLAGPFTNGQANAVTWSGIKKLCIIVPNQRTVSPEFFSWARTRRLLSRSRLVCTKEMQAVRNLDSMDITKIVAIYWLMSLLSALTKCMIKELQLAQMVSLL